jgi:hypothetical protein
MGNPRDLHSSILPKSASLGDAHDARRKREDLSPRFGSIVLPCRKLMLV